MKLKKLPDKNLIDIYKKPYLGSIRIMEIINRYFRDYQKQYINLRQNVVCYEYALGSEGLDRGYYCPSPILDIIIGGCKRGRISKTPPPSGVDGYRYGFNADGQLIIAETLEDISDKEIICYQEDSVLGVSFRIGDGSLEKIRSYMECRYENGKIKSCIRAEDPYESQGYREYVIENYHYCENGLDYVELIVFDFNKNDLSMEDFELWPEEGQAEDFEVWYKEKKRKLRHRKVFTRIHERYYFHHDEKGYLSEYNVVKYEGGKVTKGYWDGHYFKVGLKRKAADWRMEMFKKDMSNIKVNKTELEAQMKLPASPSEVLENSGKDLRRAVLQGEKGAVEFLLAHGADINYQEADMIFTFGGTSLLVAVGQENFEMVKYLVAQGADVSIPDKMGLRPYHRALEYDYLEIAQYLRNLEEDDLHNQEKREEELKEYKLPKALVEFLRQESPFLKFEDDYTINEVEFFTLADTVEMKINEKMLLRLTKKMGDYPDLILVWNPGEECIAYYDMEHEWYGNIADYEEFRRNAADYIENIFNEGGE